MNKRLKLFASILGLVYFLFIGYTTYQSIRSFAAGVQFGIAKAEKQLNEKSEPETDFIYFKVMPKSFTSDFLSAEIDGAKGEKLKIGISDIAIETTVAERSVFLKILNVLSLLLFLSLIFVIFYVPYQVYRVFYSTIKKDIFDPLNYKIFYKIGFASIYVYLVLLLNASKNYIDAKGSIFLRDYDVYFDFTENVFVLLIGVLCLFFAEILKMATKMKEEQDLTI